MEAVCQDWDGCDRDVYYDV